MGALCVIQICDYNEPENPEARIYLHWGGETFEEVANTLRTFALVNETSPDPRWTDAPYLAARFVAWAIEVHGGRRPNDHALDISSVGIVNSDEWGDCLGRIVTCFDADWPRPLLQAQERDGSWREVQIHWQGDAASSGVQA